MKRPKKYLKWEKDLEKSDWWIMLEANTFKLNYEEYKKQYIRDEKLKDLLNE
jgi:hypothetical protein